MIFILCIIYSILILVTFIFGPVILSRTLKYGSFSLCGIIN